MTEISLEVDDQILERAYRVAEMRGTTLEAMLQERPEHIVNEWDQRSARPSE